MHSAVTACSLHTCSVAEAHGETAATGNKETPSGDQGDSYHRGHRDGASVQLDIRDERIGWHELPCLVEQNGSWNHHRQPQRRQQDGSQPIATYRSADRW